MTRSTFLSLLDHSISLLKDQGWRIVKVQPDRDGQGPHGVVLRKEVDNGWKEWDLYNYECDSFRATLSESKNNNDRTYWAPEDPEEHFTWVNMMFLFSNRKPFCCSDNEMYFDENGLPDERIGYQKFLDYSMKNFQKKFKVVEGGER